MESETIARRLVQLAGILLVGNGVMGLLRPRWHSLPWRKGPQLPHAVTEEIAEHPNARIVYAAQAAIGLTLAAVASR